MSPVAEVDAIVVGAGPAGSATALLLASAGHAVLLVDRRTFPRPKACGDCLSAEAGRILDRLGLRAAVEAAGAARLRGWRIVAPDGSSFTAGFGAEAGEPLTALSLRRELLDPLLVEGACARGAVLRTPFHVTELRRDRLGRVTGVTGRDAAGAPAEVRARLVIGADGLRSIVARRLGLLHRGPRLRKLSLTAHLEGVRGVRAVGEMHLADGACLGVAPVAVPADDPQAAATTANVTLVVDSARFAGALDRDVARFFRGMLARFPAFAGRFDATVPDPPSKPRLLASGPFDWPTRDVVADGAALVGDAAGYYDPFTGQGIYQALACAEILAEEADTALRAGNADAHGLRRYARRRAALLRGARTLQHAIEFVTSRPALANNAIRRLARAPAAAEALIAAAGDLRPARSLLSPAPLLAVLFAHSHPEIP